jgi:hypothetical protein
MSVAIGTPKRFTASGAVTPSSLNVVSRYVLAGGATGPVVNLRDNSSPSGTILVTLRVPANTTDAGDLGIMFNGGLYVEVVSGNAELTLVME